MEAPAEPTQAYDAAFPATANRQGEGMASRHAAMACLAAGLVAGLAPTSSARLGLTLPPALLRRADAVIS